MTFTFVNTNKSTPDGRFPIRVHKKGCSNIGREIQRGNGNSWDIEAKTADEAIKIQEQDFLDQEMGAFDYEKEPCVKKL